MDCALDGALVNMHVAADVSTFLLSCQTKRCRMKLMRRSIQHIKHILTL